jgi:hypothetical protein
MTDLQITPTYRGLDARMADLDPGFFWTRMSAIGAEGETLEHDEAQRRIGAAMERLRDAEAGTPYIS